MDDLLSRLMNGIIEQIVYFMMHFVQKLILAHYDFFRSTWFTSLLCSYKNVLKQNTYIILIINHLYQNSMFFQWNLQYKTATGIRLKSQNQ